MKGRIADAFTLSGFEARSRISLRRTVHDVLMKPWTEGAVPVALAVALMMVVALTTPGVMSAGDLDVISVRFVETGLIVVALTVVLIGGGFDLSVGAMAGLTSLVSVVLIRAYELPGLVVLPAVLALGAFLGGINGLLIAVLKTRPLITTLVTAMTFRAVLQLTQSTYTEDVISPREDPFWAFLGRGFLAGIPIGLWIIALVLVFSHLMLTRSRWGWWLAAVGSDRRSGRRTAVPVMKVTFAAYVVSGVLCALSGLLLAARQGSASATLGDGYEIIALTAVVLGGVSIRGGRGSVIRAATGMLVVAVIGQAIFRQNLPTAANTFVLAACLLVFVVLDEKWGKHRMNVADKFSIAPVRLTVPAHQPITSSGAVWAPNRRLSEALPIGVGVIEGAEDCVVDDENRVYCGDRRGWIWRFSGENYEHHEVFARTGGTPLGHVWQPDGQLLVAVYGMGVCRIDQAGSVDWVATRTRRSRWGLHDDAPIRFADDLDLGPDGSIYFSDASTRVQSNDLMAFAAEGRPDGRVLRLDPDGSVETVARGFACANGIATAHDGMSILIASTLSFRVDRLWIAGPKQGQLEMVLENLPGLPDNINRASDGNYWLSFAGMRTPFSDLVLRHEKFRRRMTNNLPADEWIMANLNVSCVAKFDERGQILAVLWDESQERHPCVTSMSEHRGHLYLGGLHNNRIGRIELEPSEVGDIDPYAIPGIPRAAKEPV